MEITEQDRLLLSTLQQDSRISNQALAEKTGMSASASWRRIRALEQAGVIQQYTAVIDHRKAGINFHAIVLVSLERQNKAQVAQFIDAIMLREEIIECLAATGDSDYHLRVACRDQQAFNLFLENFLFQLPSVSKIHTHLVLKEIKVGRGITL